MNGNDVMSVFEALFDVFFALTIFSLAVLSIGVIAAIIAWCIS